MVLLCKLFSTAIHSVGYLHHVTRLFADEWKLTFNQSGHYHVLTLNLEKFCNISYGTFCDLPYWLLIRVKDCIVCKLLEVNCNQTKSTPKNLFKMCDFWMYSVNLGVLIHQGVVPVLPFLHLTLHCYDITGISRERGQVFFRDSVTNYRIYSNWRTRCKDQILRFYSIYRKFTLY